MPTIEASPERPLCPTGLHTLTLVEVDRKEVDDTFNGGKKEKFVWRFVADGANPETGLQHELSIWTGVKYGNAKAKLTWLIDLLVPGITPKEAIGLDTDTLLLRRYEASVKHVPGDKDPTKKFAEAVYLRPLPEVGDVFAEEFATEAEAEAVTCTAEDCGKELDRNEIFGCQQNHWPMFCLEHGKAHKKKLNAARPS